jgi:hypothetical protein
MATFSITRSFDDAAEAVWKTISDFGGIGRFFPVAKCELKGSGVGAVRTITTNEGAVLVERLESSDARARTLSYSITESPLPFTNYLATMRLRELGPKRCELAWSASYEPKGATEQDVNAILNGVFSTGCDGIAKLHGGR